MQPQLIETISHRGGRYAQKDRASFLKKLQASLEAEGNITIELVGDNALRLQFADAILTTIGIRPWKCSSVTSSIYFVSGQISPQIIALIRGLIKKIKENTAVTY